MLIRLGIVDSTQSFLARHPELGFCGVMADSQTAGRGRGNNSWKSERGAGLWLSACLPPLSLSAGTLLQSAMTSVAMALEPCGIPLGLKWPNDLVAHKQDGLLVKIGGIIGEQKGDRVILGLGLNIFSAPEIPDRAIPPASLSSLGAANIPNTVDLAKSILRAWRRLETQCPQSQIAFRWPDLGDAIRWEDGHGVCQGWEADGRLAVLTESGLVLLASGDVKYLLYGISTHPHCLPTSPAL